MSEVRADHVDVYVFRRRDSAVEFLILKRRPSSRLGGLWQAVTGRIEAGETAAQAALRELREETGLRPLALWQLEFVNTFFLARIDRVSMCPGFAAEVPSDADVTLCAEHTEFRWVRYDEAVRAFVWPGPRRALREIVDGILVRSPAEPFLRIELPAEG